MYRTRGKNLGRFGVQTPRGCMFLVFGSVAPTHCAHGADSMHYAGNCNSLDSSNAPDLPSGAIKLGNTPLAYGETCILC